MKKSIFAVLMIVLAAQYAAAGPFGLEKGMSIRDITEACAGTRPVPADREGYFVIKPHKKHSEFEKYYAKIDSELGLNYISAVGKSIECDTCGTEIRGKFEEMSGRLSVKYGKPVIIDTLKESVIDPVDDEYWMYTLRMKDRVLVAAWVENLPDELTAVYLSALAEESGNRAHLVLEYEFSNNETVVKSEDDVL